MLAGYATACLEEAGHDVIFLDAPERGWDFTQTQDAVLTAQPHLVCVNAVYFWEHTVRLFETLTCLKKSAPDVHLNLFGFFPSLIYDVLLRQAPAVDSIAAKGIRFQQAYMSSMVCSPSRAGLLTGLPSTRTLPPVTTPAARLRDLKNRACQSHLSSRIVGRGSLNPF